jgi:replicative DNA helicase
MISTDELYATWHEKADELLPEFDFFKQSGGHWISRSGVKVDGSTGNAGKVFYYPNTPFMLKDYARQSITIVKYLRERDGYGTDMEALRYMANVAGIQLNTFKSEEERQKYEAKQRIYTMLEELNAFYINCLHGRETPQALTQEAIQQRNYLTARGYKKTDYTPPYVAVMDYGQSMEAGFFSELKDVRQYLVDKGYNNDEITDVISAKLPHGVGSTHRLTFPYRNGSGHITGFIYRTISEEHKPKYLFDKGLKRGSTLFNFRYKRNNTDLIITEGILDALIATARGINNVAALLSNTITKEQARQAVKNCGGRITLCLDSDKAGQDGTEKTIEELLKAAEEAHVPVKIYVAKLPQGIKDVDELITQKGAEAFTDIILNAEREIHYWQDKILTQYADRTLTVKEQDELLESITQHAAKTQTPTDRSMFIEYFKFAFNGVVTTEALEETAEKLSFDREQNRQKEELLKTLNEVQKEIKDGGTPADILKKLEEKTQDIKAIRGRDLLLPYTYDEFITDTVTRSEGMYTGYEGLKNIKIPRGAFSLIAGRTSHGKTAFMINLAPRMLDIYKDQRFYFFSYEEQKDRLLLKMLNSLIGKKLDDILPHYEHSVNNEAMLRFYMRDVQAKRIQEVPEIKEKQQYLKDLIDSGRLTITDRKYDIAELEAIITAEHRKHGSTAGTFFIDYAQNIPARIMQQQRQDRRSEIEYICGRLEETAKNTDTALIVGAQLNRTAGAENNSNKEQQKRPRLEQLKESGKLEESANLVLSVYNEAAEHTDAEGRLPADHVNFEVQALKNRDGQRNLKAILSLHLPSRSIRDLTPEEIKKKLREEAERRSKKKNETYTDKIEKRKADLN